MIVTFCSGDKVGWIATRRVITGMTDNGFFWGQWAVVDFVNGAVGTKLVPTECALTVPETIMPPLPWPAGVRRPFLDTLFNVLNQRVSAKLGTSTLPTVGSILERVGRFVFQASATLHTLIVSSNASNVKFEKEIFMAIMDRGSFQTLLD